MDVSQVVSLLEESNRLAQKASQAALALLRTLADARRDDDEWTRFPSKKGRCHVSNYSRSTIVNLANAGTIRRKTVGRSAYYSAADVRRYIAQAKAPCNAKATTTTTRTTAPSPHTPIGSSKPSSPT